MEVPRSALFVPASNQRALEKAPGLGADTLILDLEDAVAEGEKPAARQRVATLLAGPRAGASAFWVRLNGSDTAAFGHDLDALTGLGCAGWVLPKVGARDRLEAAMRALDRAALAGPVVAMIETPGGLLAADEVARHDRVCGLILGTNDLAAEMRLPDTPDPMVLAILALDVLKAARAHGRFCLDGVFNAFADFEGFAAAMARTLALGFDGRTLIHPAQIAPCHAAFRPDAASLAKAKAIVAAFDDPANADKGAVVVDGTMVERLHLAAARRTMVRAED